MMMSNPVYKEIFKSKKPSNGGNGLNSSIVSSTKRNTLMKLEFVDASSDLCSGKMNNRIKSKYKVINPPASTPALTPVPSTVPQRIVQSSLENPRKELVKKVDNAKKGDSVIKPKVVLYKGEIENSWKKAARQGGGLVNYGVTCYINSALQCFIYTPALSNFIFQSNHKTKCPLRAMNKWCMLCVLQQQFTSAANNTGQAFKPVSVIRNLHQISNRLNFNRQEDAHEFIIHAIDAMQRACLVDKNGNSLSRLDSYSQNTTAIHQIFGLYLRSRVRCGRCRNVSDIYDFSINTSLEIANQSDIQGSLRMFVKPEVLERNAYKCDKCKLHVDATKRFSFHTAPNVLPLHLKRFKSIFQKIHRPVSYPYKLNLRPYMSVSTGEPVMYQLYAVLVHSGQSTSSGHYYMYGKAQNGKWYTFNDTYVAEATLQTVLSQQAYVLFYHRVSQTIVKHQNGVKKVGQTVSENLKMQKCNGIGSPIKRKLKDENNVIVSNKKLLTGGKKIPEKFRSIAVASFYGNNGAESAKKPLSENKDASLTSNATFKPVFQRSATVESLKSTNGSSSASSETTGNTNMYAGDKLKKTSAKISFNLKSCKSTNSLPESLIQTSQNGGTDNTTPKSEQESESLSERLSVKPESNSHNGHSNLDAKSIKESTKSTLQDLGTSNPPSVTIKSDFNETSSNKQKMSSEKVCQKSPDKIVKRKSEAVSETEVKKTKLSSPIVTPQQNSIERWLAKEQKTKAGEEQNPEKKDASSNIFDKIQGDFGTGLKKAGDDSSVKKEPITKKSLSSKFEHKKDHNNGAHRQNLLEKLLKTSTEQTFGNKNLGTWKDLKSTNATFSKPLSKKEKFSREYNRDFDKGKCKKIKKKKKFQSSGNQINRFQNYKIYSKP